MQETFAADIETSTVKVQVVSPDGDSSTGTFDVSIVCGETKYSRTIVLAVWKVYTFDYPVSSGINCSITSSSLRSEQVLVYEAPTFTDSDGLVSNGILLVWPATVATTYTLDMHVKEKRMAKVQTYHKVTLQKIVSGDDVGKGPFAFILDCANKE
jgi:hypothetical protein